MGVCMYKYRTGSSRLTKKTKEEILKLRGQGKETWEIATIVGVPEAKVVKLVSPRY